MSTKLIKLSDGTELSEAQVREYLVIKFPTVKNFQEIVTPTEAVDTAFNCIQGLIKEPGPDNEIAVEALRMQVHLSLFITCK